MKKTILIIFNICTSIVMMAQNDCVSKINNIKIDSTFLYGEATLKTRESASALAKDILKRKSLPSGPNHFTYNGEILDDIFILWKSYDEWEKILLDAAINRQSIEKLETLDFITQDEENSREEYYNMDRDLLIMILKDLEKKGKCGLLKDENGSYIAVKFFR